MIITVAGGTPLVGTATDDERFVMLYGLRGDWDNPKQANYLKMLQAGAVGFPKGREWDGTAEDAIRLHALGVEMVYSDDFTADDVEGVNV